MTKEKNSSSIFFQHHPLDILKSWKINVTTYSSHAETLGTFRKRRWQNGELEEFFKILPFACDKAMVNIYT